MALIIFNWIYILITSFTIGSYIFFRINKSKIEATVDITLICVAGLICITVLASISSLFFKTGLLINVLLIALCVFFYFNKASEFKQLIKALQFSIKENLLYIALFFICFIYILLNNIIPSDHYDEYYYYLKTLKWIQSYPVVPGLANLHSQLGFNSHWFILQSVFSLSFLNINCLNEANGFLCLLILIYSLKNLKLIYKQGLTLARAIRSLYFVAILLFINDLVALSSSSIDISVTLLTWIFLDLFIEKAFDGGFGELDFEMLLLIILIPFLITIRLSVLPLTLFSFFFLILFFKEKRSNLIIFSVVSYGIILIPFLVRNTVLTGYIMYPIYQIDLFNFDWEVTQLSIIDNAETTKSWSRIPFVNKNEVLAKSTVEWVKLWFPNHNTIQKQLLCFIPVAMLVYFIYFVSAFIYNLIKKRKSSLSLISISFLAFVLICGIVFWFTQAPMLRYGLPFLLFAAMISLCAPFYFIRNRISLTPKIFFFLIVILIVKYSVKVISGIDHKKEIILSLKPADFPAYPTDTLRDKVSDHFILIPKTGDQCGNAALPCTAPQARNPNLEFRGDSLSDGFRISNEVYHFDWP